MFSWPEKLDVLYMGEVVFGVEACMCRLCTTGAGEDREFASLWLERRGADCPSELAGGRRASVSGQGGGLCVGVEGSSHEPAVHSSSVPAMDDEAEESIKSSREDRDAGCLPLIETAPSTGVEGQESAYDVIGCVFTAPPSHGLQLLCCDIGDWARG